MRKFWAFIAGIIGVVAFAALPAAAQGAYYYQLPYTFLAPPNGNGCHVVYSQGNSGSPNNYLTAWEKTADGYPPCWVQIKVSYWDMNGTWYIYTSPWIGYPPGRVDWSFGPGPGIWWVDYNTNYGGSIYGFRKYGQGCNSSGCT